MIVVDTNVIAYLIIAGDRTETARAVLRRDPEWAAPSLWRSEFRSTLALYMRHEDLSIESALERMAKAEQLLDGREYTVASARVFERVEDSSCSAYDCEFVALAQELDVPLVTSDQEILSGFPEVALAPEQFGG